MNSVEDRIRAAIRAAEGTVRDVQPLRPLPEPGAPSRLRSGARALRARLRKTWIAPVTAAAAVLAIGVALVIVRDIPNGRVASAPSSVAPSRATASPEPSAPPPQALPAYYVALSNTLDPNSPWQVVVGNTFTGKRLATVSPPVLSTFAGVTAAGDDRTFVLDATTCWRAAMSSRLCPRTWYLLRLYPGSADPARLTRLPVPGTSSGTEVAAIALSADGRELAVAVQPPRAAPEVLSVYSVATGAVLRSWTGPAATIADPTASARADSDTALSWSADGRSLSFRDETRTWVLRMTDTGHDFLVDSRLVWTYPSAYIHGYQLTCSDAPVMTSDGTTLVCGATGEPQASVAVPSKCSPMWDNTMGFLAYSVRQPKVARPLYVYQTTCTGEVTAEVLWSAPYGQALFVWLNSAPVSNPRAPQTNITGFVSGGTFLSTPFPVNGGEPIPDQVAW